MRSVYLASVCAGVLVLSAVVSSPVHASSDVNVALYESMVKKLSIQATEKLEEAIIRHKDIYVPAFKTQDAELHVEGCRAVMAPEMVRIYDKKLQDLKYATHDQLVQGIEDLNKFLREIPSFQPKVFLDYHEPLMQEKLAVHRAIGDITNAGGGFTEEECVKHTSEIDSMVTKPYADPSVRPVLDISINRKKQSEVVDACYIRWSYQDKGREYITSLPFVRDDVRRNRFSIQQQVVEQPRGALNISNAWVDFGVFDTRFDSEVMTHSGSSAMGFIPESEMVDVFKILRERGPVMTFRVAEDDTLTAIQPAPITEESYNAIKECITMIAPDYKAAFESPSKPEIRKYQPVINKALARDENYKVSRLTDYPGTPGGCVLRFNGGPETGWLMAFGRLSEDHPYNNAFVFWTSGTNHAAPWVQATDPMDPSKTINTANMPGGVIKGGHYELAMNVMDAIPLIQGVLSTGVTFGGVGNDYKLPAPTTPVVQAYNGCLSQLLKDVE